MAQISVNYPQTGQPNSTEDPKIATALSTIVTAVNALDDANLVEAANINGSKLLNASIAAAKLASDSVETAKILASAVTTAKIANDAVTADKLADSASTDADRAVTTNHIRDNAITNAKVADNAINTAELASASVTEAKLGSASVTTDKIADSTVTAAKVAGPTGSFLTPVAGVTATATRPAFARKYNQGLVLLQGRLEKNSSVWGNPAQIATLEAGFRPAFTIVVLCTGYNSTGSEFGIVPIAIEADGDVLLNSTSSPYVDNINIIDLDGITFHAG